MQAFNVKRVQNSLKNANISYIKHCNANDLPFSSFCLLGASPSTTWLYAASKCNIRSHLVDNSY